MTAATLRHICFAKRRECQEYREYADLCWDALLRAAENGDSSLNITEEHFPKPKQHYWQHWIFEEMRADGVVIEVQFKWLRFAWKR